MVRLSTIARSKGLLNTNQGGSLPGFSSSHTCLTITHEVNTLQRPRLEVSTMFLDLKAGLDNVNASTMRARLLVSGVPSYMVDWVSSFLSERTRTLVFQGSTDISSPVSVGTPPGSPISPLLFLLYLAPLHMSIPRGLMVSYVDDFSITVASPSHVGNIRRLQGLCSPIATKGRDIGVSFSVPITKLIHWRTPQTEDTSLNSPCRTRGPPLPTLQGCQVGRILIHSRFQHHPPLQAQALVSPSYLLLCQAPLLPGGQRQTLPLPPHCVLPPPPHTHLRSGPPYPKLYCTQGHELLLAQSPDVCEKLLLLHPFFHPIPGSMPSPHWLLLQIQRAPCHPQGRQRPPKHQPNLGETPAVILLHLLLPGARLVPAPYERPLLRLPPPWLANEGPFSADKKIPPH